MRAYGLIAGLVLGSAGGALGAEPPDTVPTFHGLRLMEQDPDIPDEEKAAAWSAWVARTEKELAYGRAAARQWRSAGRLRLVAAAEAMEGDPAYGPKQRAEQWQAVVDRFPGSEEAERASERAAHWRRMELKRRVDAAEAIERAGRPKVDRIQAWLAVIEWAPKSGPARAADARVGALQAQLEKEAATADGIERLDAATKAELWRDVLRGRPSEASAARARARIQALER